jgi:hypothetical protein
MPSVGSEKLPNGLDVRIVEDHSIPVVAVRVVVGVDSTFDPPGKEGLFAVTVGAMREASATLSADALAAASASIERRLRRPASPRRRPPSAPHSRSSGRCSPIRHSIQRRSSVVRSFKWRQRDG